ncbi:hypothetical protein [Spiroplasma poulsonii]
MSSRYITDRFLPDKTNWQW